MAKLPGLFSKYELTSMELLFIVSYCYFSLCEHLSSSFLDTDFAPGLSWSELKSLIPSNARKSWILMSWLK